MRAAKGAAMGSNAGRDGLPWPARAFALTATAIGTFTSTLDTSIANVALPTIARDFHIAPELSVWVVTAFQLTVTSTLLTFAALGDRIGAARLYLAAFVVFTLASVGCALATSFEMLVAMRAVQGIAASAQMVMTAPINRTLYPRAQLGRAIANNALFVALGMASGPTISGLILAVAPWQWLFWVNVPVCAIGIAFGLRYLPKPAGAGGPLDLPSALLAASGFSAFVWGVDALARRLENPAALGVAAAGVAAFAVFVARQTRLAQPLLAVDLFRRPLISLSAAAALCTYTAQGSTYVSLPFFLQSVLGRSPLESGLLIASWPLGTLVASRIVGPLTGRIPAAVLGTAGVLVMGAGLALIALLPQAFWLIATLSGIAGFGFGFFQTPNNHTLISATPPDRTGRATGIIASVRVAGMTVGAASVAIVFGLAGTALGTAVALSLWLAAALCTAAAAFSAARRLTA